MQVPQAEVSVTDMLGALRLAGAPISRANAKAVVDGVLEALCPQVLKKNGGKYDYSLWSVGRLLRYKLGWSYRYKLLSTLIPVT